jgi:hypothetical protein
MSGPALAHEDVFAKAKELRAAGVPLDEIDAYLTTKLSGGGLPSDAPAAPHSKFTSAQLIGRADRQVENAREAEGVSDHPLAQSMLAAPLTVAQGFPGGERAAVGMSLLGRLALGQDADYGDALKDERQLSEGVPVASQMVGRAAGVLPVAQLLAPLGARQGGAAFGALSSALSAEPNASPGQWADRTALGAGLGYGAGYAADKVLGPVATGANWLASKAAPPIGRGLGSGVRDLLSMNEAATLEPSTAPRPIYDTDAGRALQQLLQRSVNEGVDDLERAANPPSNWDLMERIERSLAPNNRLVSLLRPAASR